jgi:hypothetical protein
MTVLDMPASTVSGRAPIELRLGPPLLTTRQARNWRYFAIGVAALVMLAGWLTDPYGFAGSYGLLSIVGYLLVSPVLTALTVLPTIRRATVLAPPSAQ